MQVNESTMVMILVILDNSLLRKINIHIQPATGHIEVVTRLGSLSLKINYDSFVSSILTGCRFIWHCATHRIVPYPSSQCCFRLEFIFSQTNNFF